ncbi:single-stranded DNA-binding protein [Nocardioides pyridinolyticus]
MNDCTITVRGWLGADVVQRDAGGVPVASFRLACTPRKFNRRTESWSDGETQWYTVSCWRGLAENCMKSLRRGDPVVVHGRLQVRPYVNSNDVEVISFEIDAVHVGHDLSRGTSVFTRAPRQDGTEQQAAPDPGEAAA